MTPSPPAARQRESAFGQDEAAGGSATKRRRIWAACEPCRKRKSRCDGQSPCSCCIAALRALQVSPQASSASTGSASGTSNAESAGESSSTAAFREQLLIKQASENCVFDWNRKPRGPKGKKKAAAGTSDLPSSKGRSQLAAAQARQTKAASAATGGHANVDASEVKLESSSSPAESDGAFARRVHGGRGLFGANGLEEHTWRSRNADDGAGEDASQPRPETTASSDFSSGMPSMLASPSSTSTPPGTSHLNQSKFPWSNADAATQSPFAFQPGTYPHYTGGTHPLSHRTPSPAAGPTTGWPVEIPDAYYTLSRVRSVGPHVDPRVTPYAIPTSAGTYPQSNAVPMYPSPNPDSHDPWGHQDVAYPAEPGPHEYTRNHLESSLRTARRDFEKTRATSWSHDLLVQASDTSQQPNYASALVQKLRQYYTKDETPFVALAIAQFADLDAATKLFAPRYLFQSDTRPMSSPDTTGPNRDTPAHLQLALLSLLAHRALLLRGTQSMRDLDASSSEVAKASAALGGKLSGKARKGMLAFARRSWNASFAIVCDGLSQGVVDPSFVQTGWTLRLASLEDGLNSRRMSDSTTWLFQMVVSWRLHQLDAKPDVEAQDPLMTPGASNSGAAPISPDLSVPGYPKPSPSDARPLVVDRVDRECLRRTVYYIWMAQIWAQSADMSKPSFDFDAIKLDLPGEDNLIHQGSTWTPERIRPGPSYLFRNNAVCWYWYGRLTRMLHTPLQDLVSGAGPEPDIQRAIHELEESLEVVKAGVPKLSAELHDDPLQVSSFLHSRICELLQYRLFCAISSYAGLCAAESANWSGSGAPSLRAGPMFLPHHNGEVPEKSTFESFTGFHPSETREVERMAHANVTTPRPRFAKDPKQACFGPLWEVRGVVKAALARLSTEPASPIDNGVGTGAGVTLDTSARSMRWPRHLRVFAQHAFALAAEMAVAGRAWSTVKKGAELDLEELDAPHSLSAQELENGLWDVGDSIIQLLLAMARSGSEHARQTAESTVQYKAERLAWITTQREEAANQTPSVSLYSYFS